jgi:hypothetical protein
MRAMDSRSSVTVGLRGVASMGGRLGRGGVRMLPLLCLGAAMILLAGSAQAQGQRRGGPCGNEIQKLCPDVHAGTPEFRACIEEHSDELSPECQTRVKEGRDRIDKMRAACELDIQTLCSDTEAGGGNFLRCLRTHRAELSDQCTASLPRGPQGRGGKRKAAGSKKAAGAEAAASPDQAASPDEAPSPAPTE